MQPAAPLCWRRVVADKFATELHYSSDGVREQTEELASWALSDSGSIGSTASTKPSRAVYSSIGARIRATSAPDANAVPSEDRRFSADISLPDPIAEVSEPITPQSDTAPSSPWASSSQHAGPLSKTEEADASSVQSKSVTHKTRAGLVRSASSHERSELESLLPKSKPFDPRAGQSYGTAVDLEQQGTYAASVSPKFGDLIAKVKDAARRNWSIAADPKRWTKKSLWDNVVVTPVMALPAVFLGVLLNVLDALSYGKWYDGLVVTLQAKKDQE